MPWLVGTALLHSLAVTEKRGVFKWWTLLLAIAAFSLSLLGTFLVRSGVLTSVHAFATDPTRGAYILAYLFVVVGSSLLLFSFRAGALRTVNNFSLVSREVMLVFNNVVLLIATTTVLLGTLFPLISEALGWGKLSVGPPYFNTLFVPLCFVLMLVMGIGPYFRWKQQDFSTLVKSFRWVLVLSVVLGLIIPLLLFGEWVSIRVVIAVSLSVWVAVALVKHALQRARVKHYGWLGGFLRLPRSYKGMVFAHFGLVVAVVGVAFTSFFSTEKDVRMYPNEVLDIGQYQFEFKGVQQVEGPNYHSVTGWFQVYKNNQFIVELKPEKRFYPVQRNTMTEAAIDAGLFRDLYVALGEAFDDGSWAVRVYHKPFVRWIWLGAIFMALGAIFCVMDPRYKMLTRLNKQSDLTAASEVGVS